MSGFFPSSIRRPDFRYAVVLFSTACVTAKPAPPVSSNDHVESPSVRRSPPLRAGDAPTPHTIEEGDPSRDAVDMSPENEVPIEREDNLFRPAALKLSVAVDYVGIRVRGSGKEIDDGGSHGILCGGEADEGARRCLQEVSRLERIAKSRGSFPLYVLTVSAGKPALWDSAAKLRELLGAIDTPADARLWLFARTGTWPMCGLPLPACERATEAGYELRSVEAPRCGPDEKIIVTYAVSGTGEIKLVERQRIERTRPCAIP